MEILEDEDQAEQNVAAQAQATQGQQQAAVDLIHAQVKESLANAFKRAAEARKTDSSVGVDVFNSLIAALEAGANADASAHKAISDHVKAAAAETAANKPAAGGSA